MIGSNICGHHCRISWSGTCLKTLHFATHHTSEGVHLPVAVWGICGFWAMDADAMVWESLVQPSKDINELLTQTFLEPLQYSNVALWNEAIWSVTSMSTRWRLYHAMFTLHSEVLAHLSVCSFSIHWFYTCITVISACPVSQNVTVLTDMPPRNQPFYLRCWYCPLYVNNHTYISFQVSTLFESSALSDLAGETSKPLCMPSL